MSRTGLPHFAIGEIVKGFGRGSKELGIPTANFPSEVVKKLPTEIGPGVYCGWASVDGGDVHKMVMSIGWNPFYQNKEKSMETHIMHKFANDFYGVELRVVMLEFLRPEMNFTSLESLVAQIKADIEDAERLLDDPQFSVYKTNKFFTKASPPTPNSDET